MDLTTSLSAIPQAVPELETHVRLLIVALATILTMGTIVAYIVAANYRIRSQRKRRLIYIAISLIFIVCCAVIALVALNFGFF